MNRARINKAVSPANNQPPSALNSGIDQIQKTAVLIREAVAFPCAACTVLRCAKGIGLIVHGLVVLPATELVLVLDLDTGHGPQTGKNQTIASPPAIGATAHANHGNLY